MHARTPITGHSLQLLIAGACACLASSVAHAAEQPRIYAIVIGVTGYSDGSLKHAAVDAAKFSAHIKKIFPGARVDDLIETDAHQGPVREALHGLSSLPADSFVIFYFVGHGVREITGVSRRENLYLLFKDATLTRFVGDSINAEEIIKAIDNAPRIKAMVLLDACFSGVPLSVPLDDWKKTGKRAFMIASSASVEQSIRGFFTDAILEVWSGAPGGAECLRPLDLSEKVQPRVYALSNKLMNSTLVFGGDIQMCLADLREPSSLLLFRFSAQPRTVCNFQYNDSKRMMRFDPSDAVFDLIVPKKRVSIAAECAGVKVFEKTFEPADLALPVVEVEPIVLPKYLVDMTAGAYAAKADLASARAVAAYGLDATDRFIDSAAKLRMLDPSYDTSRLLAEDWGPFGASAKFDLLSVSSAMRSREEVIEKKKADGALAKFADQLEDFQQFIPAAGVREYLIAAETDPLKKTYLQYRSYLGCAAAGDKVKADAIYSQMKSGQPRLSKQQENALDLLKGLESEDVRKSIQVLRNMNAFVPDAPEGSQGG
jgi:hypothetical protein